MSMDCSISVRICSDNEEIFNAKKTAEEMKQSGYVQPQLRTDEEPLEPLTENNLFYLAAAVEVSSLTLSVMI